MSVYTLPDLPYDYSALEPHISGKIMELHHDKHHAAYVTGANTALEKLAEARESGDNAAVNLHEKNLAFNLGGHTNHTVFWNNLSPEGGGQPEGELAAEAAPGAGDQRHLPDQRRGVSHAGPRRCAGRPRQPRPPAPRWPPRR
jgi:superoxide dismutase